MEKRADYLGKANELTSVEVDIHNDKKRDNSSLTSNAIDIIKFSYLCDVFSFVLDYWCHWPEALNRRVFRFRLSLNRNLSFYSRGFAARVFGRRPKTRRSASSPTREKTSGTQGTDQRAPNKHSRHVFLARNINSAVMQSVKKQKQNRKSVPCSRLAIVGGMC